MENKITIGTLAASMAQTTGKSRKNCEDFTREFFKLVAENLQEGETLRIKGFGSFKLVDVESRTSVNVATGEPVEIAPYKKVVFTPAKEIAAAINAPFEEFESVEMEDEIPEEIFYAAPDEEISDEENVGTERLEEGSDEESTDDIITYEAYNQIEEETGHLPEENLQEKESLKIPEEESPDIQEEKKTSYVLPLEKESDEEFHDYEYRKPRKSRFGIGFLTGALSSLLVCVIIFMLGCFFDWWPVNFGSEKDPFADFYLEQSENNDNEEDPASMVQEEPAEEEPVYDTVSTTRYLTTIAREHYGDFNFWPYIYLENESILGHPDRITPGTKVVVPPLSKYGVDPTNKEDVRTAKQKASEIYSRFK